MNTHTNNWLQLKLIVTILITLAPLAAQAELVTERYKNETAISHLFLWSDDTSVMTFAGIDLTDAKLTGWNVVPNTGTMLLVEGPEIKKSAGKFDIEFDISSSTTPFTFHYAEVLWDAVAEMETVQESGTIRYNGKKLLKPTNHTLSLTQQLAIDAHFTAPAVVPIPSSVVLMMSAIGFMGIASRKISAAARDDRA